MKQGEKKRKKSRHGMGRLFKRGTNGREYKPTSNAAGNYWIELRLNGERVRQALYDNRNQPITDRAEAEAARLRLVAPYLAKDRVEKLKSLQGQIVTAEKDFQAAAEQAGQGVLIADAWEKFEAAQNRKPTKPITLEIYELQFGRFADWMKKTYPEKLFLNDVSQEIANDFARTLKHEGRSPNTFNKYMNLLSLVWGILAAEEKNKITGNPWAWDKKTKRGIARMTLEKGGRRALTLEELWKVCATLEGEWRLLFYIGIYTGLRLADAATLQWGEVDLARGIITRMPSKISRRKGAKPVTPTIHHFLRPLLEEIPASRRNGYVMPGIAETYKEGKGKLSRQIQKKFEACGIHTHAPGTGALVRKEEKEGEADGKKKKPRKKQPRAIVQVGFHSLRHSFVSLCRDAGAPLSVVEGLVGHSNPEMTRRYTHAAETAIAAAIDSLPALGPAAEPKQLPAGLAPLPPWAVQKLRNMTGKNWKALRDEVLTKGGA